MENKKRDVNPRWFSLLEQAYARQSFEWLIPLKASVDRIINFGCWQGHEPFALIWTLDATEVIVVEIKPEYIGTFNQKLENIELSKPEALEGRSVKPLVGDVTKTNHELPANYFDLAFCDNVLYYFSDDNLALQNAIGEMKRVVRLGGWIVAKEPKYGADHKEVEYDFFEQKMKMWVPVTEPKNMSAFFESAGLKKLRLENTPPYTYCYQKV